MARILCFSFTHNLKKISSNLGILEIIEELKACCDSTEIPCIFAMRRRKLGFLLAKKVPVSCIGIISYEGCEEVAKLLKGMIEPLRLEYDKVMHNKLDQQLITNFDQIVI